MPGLAITPSGDGYRTKENTTDCNYAIPATYCGDRLVPIETVQAVIAELYEMASSFTSCEEEECAGPEHLGKAVEQLAKHCELRSNS